MKSIAVIQSEHRNIGVFLACFEQMVDGIGNKGREPKFVVFGAMMSYIGSYLGHFHHPKEDEYLFPAVTRRSADARPLVEELMDEHRRGAELARRLGESLSEYEADGGSGFDGFRECVFAYTGFERAHALKEERRLLPLAREQLAAGDWEAIDAAFCANDDPLFGARPRERYDHLRMMILNICLAGDPLL